MEFLEPLYQLYSYLERRLRTEPFFPCVLYNFLQVWSQFLLHNKVVTLWLYRPLINKRREVIRTVLLLHRAHSLSDFLKNIDFHSVDQFVSLL